MSKTTVLVVEDEAIVAADLAGKLRRLGYEVAGIAAEGEEAVGMARRLCPHLVLMDIRLQGVMDGIEAAEAIRSRHDVPVIYLTAHSDAATLARAKLTGPFGYVLKPFDERDLATQIELAVYRHQADREVREQREWLRVTLSSIGDAVIATDGEGRVSFINPVAASLIGWDAEQAVGQLLGSVFQIVNELTGETMEDPIGRVLREGRPIGLANHAALVTRDGRRVPIEDSASPILDVEGRVIGAVLVFHDVTQKRQAEAALRESEEKFRSAFANAAIGFSMMNPAGHMVAANPAYCKLTGHSVEELRTRALSDLVHPEDYAENRRLIDLMLSGETGHFVIENRYIRPDQHVLWVRKSTSLVRNEDHEPRWIITLVEDITERKGMEEALRRSRDELEVRVEERTAELSTTIARLEQANQDLQEFAHVASHDLQEPLRKIQTFCDMTVHRCAPVLDQTSLEYLDRVIKSAARMRQLLHDLLSFSRVSTRGETIRTVDLSALAREAVDIFEQKIQETGCRIEIGELPVIEADESQLLRLFQNLIGNALKFRSEAPCIRIYGGQQANGECEILVTDNGIGFDPQYAEVVFKPFQRLHGRSSQYDGTGMGLAICRKIVERHGGTIRAESKPGSGSTFVIRLPLKRDRFEASASSNQSPG